MDISNVSLYCRNLNDKIKKEDLRQCLYCLFSVYGPVLDIVVLKTKKMRGQAHIVFRDVASATAAMRALQGFSFFEKEMKIEYAKQKSNVIAKLDGTFKIPTPELDDIRMSAVGGGIISGIKRSREDDDD
ncbi:hypothetical protein T552_00622 [Pneumocystis carinii B80]|uniref:RRM domain-containing protein n=1 Tax=Pneumocystis carinii (strain B80) TaxID=1408658 RepID=A0A0W4ZP55_PNEC8|nr:hypothetical protein T552_00622 [Pneumocystis carinii B80]KTW30144.1 hypothetical protein T552_00622 [Pneumocystis carinii B80]